MRGLTLSHVGCHDLGFFPSLEICIFCFIGERPLEFRLQHFLLSVLVKSPSPSFPKGRAWTQIFPCEICAFALPNSLLYYTHWDSRKDSEIHKKLHKNFLWYNKTNYLCGLWPSYAWSSPPLLTPKQCWAQWRWMTPVCASISYVFYVLMFLWSTGSQDWDYI